MSIQMLSADEPSRRCSESFEYPVGSRIDAASGGSGFRGGWKRTSMSGAVNVLEGSLHFEGQPSTGNRIQFRLADEESTKGIRRELENRFLMGQTMWLSCLVKPIVVAQGGFWIRPASRQDLAFGKRWGTEFGIDNNGTGIHLRPGEVYRLVGRYQLLPDKTIAHLWVNRNENFTDENADATKTVPRPLHIDNLSIVMTRWGNGIMEVDELALTTTPPPRGNAN